MATLLLRLFIISIFCINNLCPSTAYAQLNLPEPGRMVNLTPAYVPLMIKGLRIHPENPLLFDFILDSGKSGLKINTPEFKSHSKKLIQYFLAALTIKEEDLWVNLSPYERNKIMPVDLGKTQLGRDMLAQDYVLKQLTASLIYPEKKLGKKFWDKVYAQARHLYGNAEVPVNTFNKVWIVADQAKVFETNDSGLVAGGHLKVMLEEDYLALNRSVPSHSANKKAHSLSSNMVRELIIPEIEREVNKGANFAPLRQMFHAMILASWYKMSLKNAILNQVYSNKAKISGVLSNDQTDKEKIYNQYLEAYKKGVFNYIKDDIDTVTNKRTPRKYFSGGELIWPNGFRPQTTKDPAQAPSREGDLALVTVNVVKISADAAMTELKRTITNGIKNLKTSEAAGVIYDLIDGHKLEELQVSEQAKKELEAAFGTGLSDIEYMVTKDTHWKFSQPSTWGPEWRHFFFNRKYVKPSYESLYKKEERAFLLAITKLKTFAEATEWDSFLSRLDDDFEGLIPQNLFQVFANIFSISEQKNLMIALKNFWDSSEENEILPYLEDRRDELWDKERRSGLQDLEISLAEFIEDEDWDGYANALIKAMNDKKLVQAEYLNYYLVNGEILNDPVLYKKIIKSAEENGLKGVTTPAKVEELEEAEGYPESPDLFWYIAWHRPTFFEQEPAGVQYSHRKNFFHYVQENEERLDWEEKAELFDELRQEANASGDSASKPDPAQETRKYGGIDLNSKNMKLSFEKHHQGINLQPDPLMAAEFRQGNFTGVDAVIIKITPIQNLI